MLDAWLMTGSRHVTLGCALHLVTCKMLSRELQAAASQVTTSLRILGRPLPSRCPSAAGPNLNQS